MKTITYTWPAVGQETARRLFEQQLRLGVPAHAFMLYGPDGTGRDDLAKSFIMSLFCSATIRPCGECEQCRAVYGGMHPDIVITTSEGDSLGVDHIREVKRLLRLRPVYASRRIAWIQTAEHMTLVAANALLKVLEEPPRDVVIILTASRISTLPKTLLSRCQLIRCVPLPDLAITQLLENVSADESLRSRAALLAGGRIEHARLFLEDGGVSYTERMRKALSFLDASLVSRLLMVADWSRYRESDSETLELSDDQTLLEDIESLLRDMLLIRSGVGHIIHLQFRDALERAAVSYPLIAIRDALRELGDLRLRTRGYAHRQLSWEFFSINI